jgi:hypothetical protein
MFLLTDAWQEAQLNRKVFKFRLELDASELNLEFASDLESETTRINPSTVKLEVWKRDDGKCVLCGAADNLHYDHDVPYSKGGSSLTAKNIRLLCARHNLAKSDKIERILRWKESITLRTVLLLIISNVFMTFAWYGHLKYRKEALWKVIIASWSSRPSRK